MHSSSQPFTQYSWTQTIFQLDWTLSVLIGTSSLILIISCLASTHYPATLVECILFIRPKAFWIVYPTKFQFDAGFTHGLFFLLTDLIVGITVLVVIGLVTIILVITVLAIIFLFSGILVISVLVFRVLGLPDVTRGVWRWHGCCICFRMSTGPNSLESSLAMLTLAPVMPHPNWPRTSWGLTSTPILNVLRPPHPYWPWTSWGLLIHTDLERHEP